MKIILSRKGFDSKAGVIASPIMPDGSLLSMPIPSIDGVAYSNLEYNNVNYSKILEDLGHKGSKLIQDELKITKLKGSESIDGQVT